VCLGKNKNPCHCTGLNLYCHAVLAYHHFIYFNKDTTLNASAFLHIMITPTKVYFSLYFVQKN
jgi:hypothetical protein